MSEEIFEQTLLKADPTFNCLKLAKISMIVDFCKRSLKAAAMHFVSAGYVRERGDDRLCQVAGVLANWSRADWTRFVCAVYPLQAPAADDMARRTAGNGHLDGDLITDGAGQVFCFSFSFSFKYISEP